MNKMRKERVMLGLVALVLFWTTLRFGVDPVAAARISDVRGTKHNLSATAAGTAYTIRSATPGRPCTADDPCTGTTVSRTMMASTETEICVFCHTPHAATSTAGPLWNRQVKSTGYTVYGSSSLDATQVSGLPPELEQPGGSSKLCLSCHDGTLAIGSVNVYAGRGGDPANPQTIATVAGDNAGKMPVGKGATTGFTRNLGVDLGNDHPISVTYNSDVAQRDGEMVIPGPTTPARVRSPGVKPTLPLEKTGTSQSQVQCATCHDPHLRDTDATFGSFQKFLRLNRFQKAAPAVPYSFNEANDIICLACHDKNSRRDGGVTATVTSAWAVSAHAHPDVANETYTAGALSTTDREFPGGLQVYQAACLNCHDAHTVQGATRLLREGATGGAKSQETVCYQCHAGGANTVTLTAPGDAGTNPVPNIRSDFLKTYKMPIGNGTEAHDIAANFDDSVNILGGPKCDGDGKSAGTRNACGADLVERRTKLNDRHAECTDCHNPHRVIRNPNGLPGVLTAANTKANRINGASGAAHYHVNDATTLHTNRISGALRGSWGVEPNYGSQTSFQVEPGSFRVLRGDPGSAAHADCNWTVTNPGTTTPSFNSANRDACNAPGVTYVTREYQICLKCHSNYAYGSTPPGSGPSIGKMDLQQYTNQAKEFQAPDAHRGEVSASGTGASSTYDGAGKNNHRSWHPVMDSTGRTTGVRRITSTNPWLAPWNNAVGTQTMYCTDCHGSETTGTTVIPTGTNPWGPHGSNYPFLLKGAWENATGATAEMICFKCHNSSVYNGSGSGQTTGFYGSKGNLHNYHKTRIGKDLRCTWCHVAVPHGWKNKALLVNLTDVGPEAGQVAGTAISDTTIVNNGGYTKGPYYYKAYNKIKTFAVSGSWEIGNCGNGDSDKWMRSNTDPSRGEGICKNPQ